MEPLLTFSHKRMFIRSMTILENKNVKAGTLQYQVIGHREAEDTKLTKNQNAIFLR